MKNYELRNGVSIPEIGYGTWKTPDGETCEKAVETAIRLGYHHIDAEMRRAWETVLRIQGLRGKSSF